MNRCLLFVLLFISLTCCSELEMDELITESEEEDWNENHRRMKVHNWNGGLRNEDKLLKKIKLDHFHSVFERIPVEVFYFGFRRSFFEAIRAFNGEIQTWQEFGRLLVDYFERTGQFEFDAGTI